MSLCILRSQYKALSGHFLFPSGLLTLLVVTKTHISLFKIRNARLLEKAFKTCISLIGPK